MNDDLALAIGLDEGWLTPDDIRRTDLAESHSGMLVALWLDAETADQLALDEGETADSLHVTLCYCKPAPDRAAREGVVAAVKEAVLSPPLTGEVNGYGRFNGSGTSDGKDVFYASPDVPGLNALRERIAEALTSVGYAPRSDHGYTPHITLAYVDADAENPVQRLPPIKLEFRTVRVSIGEEVVSRIPLKTPPVGAPQTLAEWNEEDHPRDEQGRFTSVGAQAWSGPSKPDKRQREFWRKEPEVIELPSGDQLWVNALVMPVAGRDDAGTFPPRVASYWVSDVEVSRYEPRKPGRLSRETMPYHRERIFPTREEALADLDEQRKKLDARNWEEFLGKPVKAAEWDPEKHPRDEEGKFTNTGGVAKSAAQARVGKEAHVSGVHAWISPRVIREAPHMIRSMENAFDSLPTAVITEMRDGDWQVSIQHTKEGVDSTPGGEIQGGVTFPNDRVVQLFHDEPEVENVLRHEGGHVAADLLASRVAAGDERVTLAWEEFFRATGEEGPVTDYAWSYLLGDSAKATDVWDFGDRQVAWPRYVNESFAEMFAKYAQGPQHLVAIEASKPRTAAAFYELWDALQTPGRGRADRATMRFAMLPPEVSIYDGGRAMRPIGS